MAHLTVPVSTNLQIARQSGFSNVASPLLPSRSYVTLFIDTPVTRKALADTVLILRRMRPNVLIVGEGEMIEAALDGMRPHLAEPIAYWTPWTTASWPGEGFRTLIVAGVDEMSLEQQHRLMLFNDGANGDVQVISTTKASLFDVVAKNAFLERLYYQLNVLLLDLRNQ